MKIELKKWTQENKKDLIRICNSVDRTYLSERLPDPCFWTNLAEKV